jgi:peptidyl-prolyl cis-trans isomerase SurA
MKKLLVLLVVCLAVTKAYTQTLFTYGPYAVGKDEFLRAYNKNKTPVTDKEKALKEYFDLYSKFKLKVKTAQLQQMDTLQQLQYDMQNFRSQVADGYMNDEKGLNHLVDEALRRSQQDIHVLHFSVAINAKMDAADTLKAYKALNELADEVKTGKTNYSEMVDEITKKYTEVKGKDLGFITAFSLPYEIENLVYDIKAGEITKLYRTKSALHFFKNVEERKSAGKWKIAQILLAIPPSVSGNELKAIELKADSIYNLLIAGADFATLAKQFSEDKLTYVNGGELPEFGTGKFELPFETKVFELKKDGEISKPIFTGYGYHIIKRLQQRQIPADKTDEAFLSELKQKIAKDSRNDAVKAAFLKAVKLKTGYKRNEAIKDIDLFRYADSVTVNNQVGNYPINNKTIFSFAKLNVKGADWLNFVKDYKLNADVYKGESNKDLFEKYIATASFEYYRKHLEEYDNEFKYQMQEFKEGNMLFEIMERNVWSKAANDSVGLLKYYTAHKTNYKWAASANILLFNCSDIKAAEDAAAALRNGKTWKQIAEESDGKLQSDSGRYELAQIQLPTGTTMVEGLITKPVANTGGDNTASFVKVLKIFPENQQRTFDEAKGLVINDYQNYLEEQWVAELKKKYPVKLNDAVFQSLLK